MDEHTTPEEVLALIKAAHEAALKLPRSREASLVATSLDQARHWAEDLRDSSE